MLIFFLKKIDIICYGTVLAHLLVQKSTSYNMDGCSQCRRSAKGGVSGPAEDLRPVSDVVAGVNFRPAGRRA